MSPSIKVFNRQRKRPLDLGGYRRFAQTALIEVARRNQRIIFPPEIEILLVSDQRIRQIHRDFLAVDTITDVITFDHGEIFISVETAERHARQFSTGLREEIYLYIIHALLHLAGFDDKTEQESQRMGAAQTEILREIEATLIWR